MGSEVSHHNCENLFESSVVYKGPLAGRRRISSDLSVFRCKVGHPSHPVSSVGLTQSSTARLLI